RRGAPADLPARGVRPRARRRRGLRPRRAPDAGHPRRDGGRAAAAAAGMRAAEAIEVSAPPSVVWKVVADPTRYLHFLSGFTRWEVVSDDPGGVGARYRMLMRVGSAEIGGLVEVVEWVPERELAWNSITGIGQRRACLLRERPRAA